MFFIILRFKIVSEELSVPGKPEPRCHVGSRGSYSGHRRAATASDLSLGFCSLYSHRDSVFQQSDQLSETVSAGCLRKNVLRVFPSHVGASFQLALAFDKMKSCRHKRYRHLILSWFRARFFRIVGARFSMWVRVFNLHFPDKMEILSPQDMQASDPRLVPNWR